MKLAITLLAMLWTLNSSAAGAAENKPAPDTILKQVRDREDGKDYVSNVLLRITDADGNVRNRHMYMLQKDMADKEMVMLLFHEPADVRDVGFMMTTYPEQLGKDDDQWMYFPAFRKIRRIAAQDKRGSFMGSTFAYTDLDKLRVSDFKSTLASEETLAGRPVWIIDRVSASQEVINKTGYHRTRIYVDKERFIVLKQEYFDIKDIEFKQQRSEKVELIEGIWTVTHSVMENSVNGQQSEMIFADMDYNVDLQDQLFSRKVLKRGITAGDVPQLTSR